MNPGLARVRPDMTADEAIAYLRRQAGAVETIYYAYALDALSGTRDGLKKLAPA